MLECLVREGRFEKWTKNRLHRAVAWGDNSHILIIYSCLTSTECQIYRTCIVHGESTRFGLRDHTPNAPSDSNSKIQCEQN